MNQNLDQLRHILDSSTRVTLTTHINPDGDGLGSQIAFAEALRARGKSVQIINDSETPPLYRFLDPTGSITRYVPGVHDDVLARSEAIIVLDTNHPSRLGSMADVVQRSPAQKIIIDHHVDAHDFADVYFLDERSAATGALVYHILTSLGMPISSTSAQALYVAIMTDTGSFRFPKTDAALHRMVAELITLGADPVGAYQQVYEQDPPGRVRLLGMALAGIETAGDGAIAHMTVTSRMFKDTGTSEADVDRFAPFTLTIRGVRIGLMFTELEGLVKVSFRSKGDIAINKLAQEFGGNGHRNAAGARLPGRDLPGVIRDVLSRAVNYL